MTPASVIEAALSESLPVFPVRLDKRPAVTGWADTGPEGRQQWAHELSWPLMGLALEGRAVLDLDAPELPDDLAAGELDGGTLVQTRRGRHWHFALPDGPSARQRIGWREGVDLKAGPGSYMIVPPSAGYKLLAGSLTAPAPAPGWLVDAVTAGGEGGLPSGEQTALRWEELCNRTRRWHPKSARAEKTIRDLVDVVREAEPGTQQAILNRQAYILGRKIGRYRFESIHHAELSLLAAARAMVAGNPADPWTTSSARPVIRRGLLEGFARGVTDGE